MAITSVLCVGIGCYTPYLYQMLPYPVDYHPYTAYHVSETLQILLFTAAGFFLFLSKLIPTPTISLDMDWFYRMGGRAVYWLARGLRSLMVSARGSAWFDWNVIDGVVDGLAGGVRSLGDRVRHLQTRQLQFNILFAVVAVVVMLLTYLLIR